MILIVTVLVFLASTALVLGAEALRERMASHAISARLARPTLHTRVLTVTPKDRRRSVLPWLDRALHGFALGDRIDTVILQSGVNIRAGVLVLVSACAAAAGLLSGVLVLHSLGLATLLAPIGATLPWLWVLERRHSRSMAFSREFPDALGLLVSGLRAGLSVSTCARPWNACAIAWTRSTCASSRPRCCCSARPAATWPRSSRTPRASSGNASA